MSINLNQKKLKKISITKINKIIKLMLDNHIQKKTNLKNNNIIIILKQKFSFYHFLNIIQ